MPLTVSYTEPSSGSVVFADPTDGFAEGSAAKFWTKKPVGARQYSVERDDAPSVDGMILHRHGFRGLPLGPFEIWYINTTVAACIAAFIADRDNIENKKVTIAVPDWSASFSNCNVEKFEPSPPKQHTASIYRMRCMLILTQDRLT